MSLAAPYLGDPATVGMFQLPIPPSVDAPASRGDHPIGLIGGGTTVVKWLDAKRTYTYAYEWLDDDEADLIAGFHEGLLGEGPFRLVDCGVRNVLPLDVASCGARSRSAVGWVPSAGSVASSTAVASPQTLSGVLAWSGTAASATLQPGTAANTADVGSAPVVLADQPVTVSLYVRASGAQSMSLQAVGYDMAGAVVDASHSTAFTSSIAWQRITCTVAAGGLGASLYVLPRLVLGATAPSTVYVAAAMVEYAATASSWQKGYGCPAVSINTPPGRTVPIVGSVNATLVLQEA